MELVSVQLIQNALVLHQNPITGNMATLLSALSTTTLAISIQTVCRVWMIRLAVGMWRHLGALGEIHLELVNPVRIVLVLEQLGPNSTGKPMPKVHLLLSVLLTIKTALNTLPVLVA